MKEKTICTKFKKIIMLCILCVGLLLTGCKSDTISKTGIYFDTVITITLYGTKDEAPLDGCFALADTYEKLFSRTIEGSDISNINESNATPVTVDEETMFLLDKALHYATITDGAVDPTICPLSDLWAFGSDVPYIPSEEELSAALSHVDYNTIILDKTAGTVTLTDPDAAIDLGFIAKGYIADKMKEYLLSEGIESALINLGGNVLTIGNKPDGMAFQIGIQEPFSDSGIPITTVSSTDSSVVTSGVYERYFYENNTLYHHILNTDTGYPIHNNLLEVTILSSSSMEGDALSTTCFVLGLKEGIKLIESLSGVEAIFVTDDYELHYSSGLS